MVSASGLLIGVETRSFDVVFFVRYQFWFANGTGYQYDGAHCLELFKSVQKIYELLIDLFQNDIFLLFLKAILRVLPNCLIVHSSTKPSSRPKTNKQSIKKFSSLAVSWVKVVKYGKISTFKVNFLCQTKCS